MKNNKKPLRKIILWNILALVMLLVLADAATYGLLFYRFNYGDFSWVRKYEFNGKLVIPRYNTNTLSAEEGIIKTYKPREPAFPPANIPWRRPIVAFGCSYTYGQGLEREQTYPYKLAALTGRPVYNLAQDGWSVQHMLFELETGLGLDGINNPEFVIYLFITDQLRRFKSPFGNYPWPAYVYTDNAPPYLTYVENKGRLEPKKYRFKVLVNWLLFDQIYEEVVSKEVYGNSFLSYNKRPAAKKEMMDFVKMHFLQSYEDIRKRWPDAKFVIMLYDNPAYDGTEAIWPDLEKDGITVIRLLDVARGIGIDYAGTREYMMSATDPHPNEKFWDVMTPAIARKLDEISAKGTLNAN
ncbi:MAG: hypothetical protein FWF35_02460 [Elusimicrobia bacterium]|nr:hypothetical protein [Elusimicrobiota bacterium]